MKCPLCETAAVIMSAKYIIEGDTSESEETKLFMLQELACRNPHCKNNGVVIQSIKTPMKHG